VEQPTSIGAYRILGPLAEGGMGVVLRARHRSEVIAERQGGDVALKLMRREMASRPDFRQRFEREAGVGLRLEHPGIVNVHDLVVDGENLALVMELVDGRPLNEAFAGQQVPPNQVVELVLQIAEALNYAHEAGVVHRDLKPANVMVDGEGRPRILDFGIAKERGGSGTRTGTGMGTVAYMAPEQYRDAKRVDRRADVYALAMIAYELLAGRLPFDEPCSEFSLLRSKAEGDLPPILRYAPQVGGPVDEVLSMGLAPEIEDRFYTPLAFGRALRSAAGCSAPEPIEPRESPGAADLAVVSEARTKSRAKSRRLPVKGPLTDGLAVASLVLSLIGAITCVFPLSIVAVVLGVASAIRVQNAPDDYTGGGIALAGILFGALGTAVGGFFVLAFFGSML